MGGGEWDLIGSEVLDLEVEQTPSAERREAAAGLVSLAASAVLVGQAESARMYELVGMGFAAMDALHIACAESAACDVLLSTDDKLLKRAKNHHAELRVRVANPLVWIQEQLP